MSKKIYLFSFAAIGIVVMAISLVLFITKEVGGFDIFDSSSNKCTPYNVFINKGDKDYSVEISWFTKEKCIGFVQYSKDSSNMNLIGVDLTSDVNSKSHNVVLENLLTTERYFFVINSGDEVYGTEGIPLEFRIVDL